MAISHNAPPDRYRNVRDRSANNVQPNENIRYRHPMACSIPEIVGSAQQFGETVLQKSIPDNQA
jgi:hypothetical protein